MACVNSSDLNLQFDNKKEEEKGDDSEVEEVRSTKFKTFIQELACPPPSATHHLIPERFLKSADSKKHRVCSMASLLLSLTYEVPMYDPLSYTIASGMGSESSSNAPRLASWTGYKEYHNVVQLRRGIATMIRKCILQPVKIISASSTNTDKTAMHAREREISEDDFTPCDLFIRAIKRVLDDVEGGEYVAKRLYLILGCNEMEWRGQQGLDVVSSEVDKAQKSLVLWSIHDLKKMREIHGVFTKLYNALDEHICGTGRSRSPTFTNLHGPPNSKDGGIYNSNTSILSSLGSAKSDSSSAPSGNCCRCFLACDAKCSICRQGGVLQHRFEFVGKDGATGNLVHSNCILRRGLGEGDTVWMS